ncbi:MAG: hypothetical protein HW414_1411 [Dehalococcoidia bacterium]|nr:hypothetical protein [Dehalococcoidia bacterium]
MTYPVALKVDRPEKLSRLTTFFRIFMAVPQMVVFAFVGIAAQSCSRPGIPRRSSTSLPGLSGGRYDCPGTSIF